MIDFNDTAALRPDRIDLDAVVARLRDDAGTWVPRLFPSGRREEDVWRLANIRGDAPRKQGSCVITLKGERAAPTLSAPSAFDADPAVSAKIGPSLKRDAPRQL